jgi:hypothetical protein
MAKSSIAGKSWSWNVLRILHAHRPIHRALDVGAGLGFYAQFRRAGQHWTAVDIWGPFVQAYELEKKYDRVIIGDMRFMDWRHFTPLDLVICGDVLEHMTKPDAIQLLRQALSNARVVLVSIPIVFSDQHEILGNPFEKHVKPDWSNEECMASFPNICVAAREEDIGVYLLTRSADDFNALQAIVRGELTAPVDPNEKEVRLIMPSSAHPDLLPTKQHE